MPDRCVVMFSGGIGSWAAAMRARDRFDEVTLLFCDVGGDHTEPHAAEDEDTYRFLNEAAGQIGTPLVTLNQGETIWDVFMRRKFLGNSRIAPCSIELKQKPAHAWMDEHCEPDTTVVIGIDWSESHRLPAVENAYAPYAVWAPMTEPAWMDKRQMIDWCRSCGVNPPRLYATGAAHNNCGGGCVRAGHVSFIRLLDTNPARFAFWEQQEQQMRDFLGKDVSILRDHTGDGPLTLATLRAIHESDQLSMFEIDLFDEGGCGCFVQEMSDD